MSIGVQAVATMHYLTAVWASTGSAMNSLTAEDFPMRADSYCTNGH